MKYLITENQLSFIRRRISLIDDTVKYVLYELKPFDEDWYLDDFIEEICWQVHDILDNNGHHAGSDTDDLFSYIEEKYGESMRFQFYNLQIDNEV